jgi:hypothetical protein
MDFNAQPTNSTPALTSEIAGQVYNLIKQFGDADKAYKMKGDSAIDPEHFDLVNKELDRIVSELNLYKNGSKLLTAAEYGAEGNLTKEAVYYQYTTDADLAKQVSSEYLNVATIIEDVM